jgi:hypothetical protein
MIDIDYEDDYSEEEWYYSQDMALDQYMDIDHKMEGLEIIIPTPEWNYRPTLGEWLDK